MFNYNYIKFLEKEIEWLKQQVEREKKRADLAIDSLLALKSNSSPIMPEKYNFTNQNVKSDFVEKNFEAIKNEIESVGEEIENGVQLEKEVI